MTTTAWVLLGSFGVVAALDWVAVHRRSRALEYVCKPGCMLLLIGAALALDPVDDAARVALVVALVLSTAGDVFLMVAKERPVLFVAGLGSFLLAHVAYVVGFALDGLEPGLGALGAAIAVGLVVGVGRPLVRSVRRGDEPALAVPVAAYVVVIAAMAAVALATGDPRAVAGAVLFTVSDALIGQRNFVRAEPWHPLAIIVTYHAAQALLVLSFT